MSLTLDVNPFKTLYQDILKYRTHYDMREIKKEYLFGDTPVTIFFKRIIERESMNPLCKIFLLKASANIRILERNGPLEIQIVNLLKKIRYISSFNEECCLISNISINDDKVLGVTDKQVITLTAA